MSDSTVTLISPLNDSTGQLLETNFSWSLYPTDSSATYELQVATDSSFSNIIFDLTEIPFTSRIVSNLDSGIEYYWQVIAFSDSSYFDSSTWSFTTASIAAPNIILLSGGTDYSTDDAIQTISGMAPSNTVQIQVNGSLFGVSYTAGENIWSWTGTLSLGVNEIQVTAIIQVGSTYVTSAPAFINITLVQQQESFLTVSAPTGVSLRSYQNMVQIITSESINQNIVGYNFYVSYQSGGVNGSYVKINSSAITEMSFYQDSTSLINSSTETVGEISVTTLTQQITRNYYYSTNFDSTAYNTMVQNNQLPNVGFNQGTDFYFVVTETIYDPTQGKVTESPYSIELEGSPLTILSGLTDLPARTRQDISLTFNTELMSADTGIDSMSGTVFRDITDPIAEENARLYVIQDFLSIANSVSTLQDFDDPTGSGVSIPPSNSPAKTALQIALNLTTADAVQALIDNQFDKLASNCNTYRLPATSAVGSVVFYTVTAPIRDMQVSAGAIVSTLGDVNNNIQAQSYSVLETKVLSAANKAQYFNSSTQQYELECAVQAITPGSAGNTDADTIRAIGTGVDSGFSVENPNPISFGTDLESNYELAGRMQLAFFADTGTKGGYAKTTIAVPYVQNVVVQGAGDPLMIRDYDPTTEEHIGGKVDIYVQGSIVQQEVDNISFAFSSSENMGQQIGERFDIVNAVAFQIESLNPLVTAHTPIFDVLNVYNATRGASYNLGGLTIIGDGNIIALNVALNSSIGMATTDIIYVDYLYRSSDTIILQNQPVIDIVSIVGQLSGVLTSDNWELVKLQDPLDTGNSTISQDGVLIQYANGIPGDATQAISQEQHVLIYGVTEPLDLLGIIPSTIVVTSTTFPTVTYTENLDYNIFPGSNTTAINIEPITSGAIKNGETVYVNYSAFENFAITYTTNALLENVQTKINLMKHACADVIVKQAVNNNVNITMTVVPLPMVITTPNSSLALTSQITSTLANFISNLGVGVSLTQSDVVKTVNSVTGVDYVVLPFSTMIKADGSFITRDNIGSPTFEIYISGNSIAYITTEPVLSYSTIDQGGPSTLFKAIFENNVPLILQTDPLAVSKGPGLGYILSTGQIIISTIDGSLPDINSYQVAYWVYGETGSNDIQVNELEYLSLGVCNISYGPVRTIKQTL